MVFARKIPPPPTHFYYYYFCFLIYLFICLFFGLFAMFYVDMGHFFYKFFCIFYVYNFWDSRYRKKKKRGRGVLIGQPQGLLSESRWFVLFKLLKVDEVKYGTPGRKMVALIITRRYVTGG